MPPFVEMRPAMASSSLFRTVRLGALELPHRVLMAPMTRDRAPGEVPNDLMRDYYLQRASAGLIITEATQVSPRGIGYPDTPGIYSQEHEDGWRGIVDAVHAADGRIALQLWHVGRVSHPVYQPNGALPVSASAIAIEGSQLYTPEGMKDFPTPRALDRDEIPGVVEEFAAGAAHAKAAGFDAVEIHGANGYLVDQFLRDGSNHRTDSYGGPIDNRLRFLREVVGAVVDVFGGDRVGIRLSPTNPYNGMADSDPRASFVAAAAALARYGLAYLHINGGASGTEDAVKASSFAPQIRAEFRGPILLNGGYDARSGAEAIDAGVADAIAYGVPFLANPDLPARYREGAPLNSPRVDSFYTPGPEGYIDYPDMAAATA